MADPERLWARAGLSEEAYRTLAEALPASELWSLLLEVLGQRAASRSPAALLQQHGRDGFVRPAPVDQRTLLEVDRLLLAAAGAFEAVELAPLAPLGACSAMGRASQHKVVSALRGTEVVSDPTNVLALECAARLRAHPEAVVRLATSHRCVRAQALPDKPGFVRHFRLFALATAGRERQDHAFAVEALAEQARVMRAALDDLERHGYRFGPRQLRVLASKARAGLGDRLASALQAPGLAVQRQELEHAYYDGLRYQIDVTGPGGEWVPLIDGGLFDWLGRLTSNRRLVLAASGMGSQLVPVLFRAPPG